MKNHYYLRHRHPSGITLIEVMFASGIALFGLLVVVALIPLAGNEVRIGLQTDRMAALGRNAVKEFDIRGMRDPKQWCDQSGKLYFYSGAYAQAYAIDPRFVARNGDILFPYSANANFGMRRISLNSRLPKPSIDTCIPLSKETADQLFIARDDLILEFPDDRTLISTPFFGLPKRKRQYRGELSWMATVIPVPSNDPFNDEYVLSIIVFSSRNMAQEKYDKVDAEVANVPERTCGINFLSGGYTGGEVELSHPIPDTITTPEQKQLFAENVLKLQTNSWVMLSGKKGIRQFFRWYRVLNVGSVSIVGSGSAVSRPVTLQGADWELTSAVVLMDGRKVCPNTRATIMEGVVGVFEKRIRLETSSLW